MAGSPPPVEVLAAFGADGSEPIPLAGGEGRSWLAGDVALKPVGDETVAIWSADLLARVREDGFRVARPVASSDGRWTVLRWAASRRVEGEHAPRWAEVIGAGEAFHRAVRHEPRPRFLDARDDLGHLLIRALIYRLVTHAIFHPGAVTDPAMTRAVNLACDLGAAT